MLRTSSTSNPDTPFPASVGRGCSLMQCGVAGDDADDNVRDSMLRWKEHGQSSFVMSDSDVVHAVYQPMCVCAAQFLYRTMCMLYDPARSVQTWATIEASRPSTDVSVRSYQSALSGRGGGQQGAAVDVWHVPLPA
eukprot:618689-Rhodomonas_salina.1